MRIIGGRPRYRRRLRVCSPGGKLQAHRNVARAAAIHPIRRRQTMCAVSAPRWPQDRAPARHFIFSVGPVHPPERPCAQRSPAVAGSFHGTWLTSICTATIPVRPSVDAGPTDVGDAHRDCAFGAAPHVLRHGAVVLRSAAPSMSSLDSCAFPHSAGAHSAASFWILGVG
jgi:hypothetical protein